ncbi:uncharacterized protein LOC100694672 isoform X1 [Oreochromis niloticus]|uniref:Scavenger receptor class B, member 2a n=1 Tax=Oreochromis niloticus TaxID=8128 RepID=A0A669CLX5_ORENI|nr:uncharacterized protein LOC100694672 isoform X1 [Oreochromis niloticus]
MTRKSCAIYTTGFVCAHLLIVGIAMEVTLTEKSQVYESWKNPPPSYLEYYFFNVTNPEVFMAGGKASVKQIGPYTYRVHRPRENVTFLENGTKVYALNPKTFVFVPEKSVGDPQVDIVRTVNIPLVTIMNELPSYSFFLRTIVSMYINSLGIELFMTRTVHEVLWGFEDPLLTKLHSMKPEVDEYFGLMWKKNGTHEGEFVFHTGEQNYLDYGKIDTWNGMREMSWWSSNQSNMINGTDGTVFHPLINRDELLYIFVADLCRSIHLAYVEDVEVKGIQAYRFAPPSDVLMSPKNNPTNAGFCVPAGDCLGTGVLKVSVCREGAPIVVSSPHFYQADPAYINAIDGLNPKKEEHESYLDLQPTTGVPIRACKRAQLNMILKRVQGFPKTKNITKTIFPIMFVNEMATIDDESAAQMRSLLLNTPQYNRSLKPNKKKNITETIFPIMSVNEAIMNKLNSYSFFLRTLWGFKDPLLTKVHPTKPEVDEYFGLMWKEVTLTEKSQVYESWKNPPPSYLEYYFFNVTNPEVFMAGGKASVKQIGPYTYRVHSSRENVTFLENGTKVYALNPKTFVFVPEKSIGDPQVDIVRTVNIPFVTIMNELPSYSFFLRTIVSMYINSLGIELFMTRTVHEVLWGFEDPLLTKLHSMKPEVDEYFGLMWKKNGTHEGEFVFHTGEQNYLDYGKIDTWNGMREMSWWSSNQSNMINGTDGTVFHPLINRDELLYIFAADFCRSIHLAYVEDVEVKGIQAYRFAPPSDVLMSPKNNPTNAGFCVPAGDCLGTGVHKVSVCREGAPIVVSFPHFYQADPAYINAIDGLNPNKEEHETYLDLQPTTGVPIRACKRAQLNMILKRVPGFPKTKNITETIFPIMFINEMATTDDESAAQMRSLLLNTPQQNRNIKPK